MWKFRPTALHNPKYATMTPDELYQVYMSDNEKAANDGVAIPSHPAGASSNLRTCQWNVRYFAGEGYGEETGTVQKIVDQLLQVNADVIVLNEFGQAAPSSNIVDYDGMGAAVKICRNALQQHGYSVHTSPCIFPTAVATKLPLVGQVQRLNLDNLRAAVAVPIAVPNKNSQSLPTKVWIYGTHLEAGDDRNGEHRHEEMERLLEILQKQDADNNNINGNNNNNHCTAAAALIIGDFNQQRAQDYTEHEWEKICESKQRRDSPENDGVATLLQNAGFQCVFDKDIVSASSVKCNWPCNDDTTPPPSTHWSNTLVDYTYFRGPGLCLEGVYVSPSGLSDHRLVVCDWAVGDEGGTN